MGQSTIYGVQTRIRETIQSGVDGEIRGRDGGSDNEVIEGITRFEIDPNPQENKQIAGDIVRQHIEYQVDDQPLLLYR